VYLYDLEEHTSIHHRISTLPPLYSCSLIQVWDSKDLSFLLHISPEELPAGSGYTSLEIYLLDPKTESLSLIQEEKVQNLPVVCRSKFFTSADEDFLWSWNGKKFDRKKVVLKVEFDSVQQSGSYLVLEGEKGRYLWCSETPELSPLVRQDSPCNGEFFP